MLLYARLHRLSLSEPGEQLRVDVIDRVQFDVMSHTSRSNILTALDAFVIDLVIENEADAHMVLAHAHAGEMMFAHEVDR